ncbi:MAG: TetR/AcrR family transcriptional regulator [Acidimicrobiia bacterium]
MPLRSRVVERSLHVFSEHGYEATSVAMLCDAAGISVGSLYHHFANKAGVAAAVYADVLESYQQTLINVTESVTSAEAGVRGLVGAHHEWVARNTHGARFLMTSGNVAEISGSAERWRPANDALVDELARWAEPHMEAGELRRLDPAVFAAVIFGPSYMHSTATLSRRMSPGDDTVDTVLAFAEAAWRALRADESGTSAGE